MIAGRFGENLREARRAAGLTQETVAFRANLHRTEIGLLERGERVPRIDTLLKLAGAVGVEVRCPLLNGIAWTPGTLKAGAFDIGGDCSDG